MAHRVPDDLTPVGRIVDAYGLRGWVKVETYNDPTASVLLRVRRWWLQATRTAPNSVLGETSVPPAMRTVERARAHAGTVIAKPVGCEDREAALALRGQTVQVSRTDFPPGEEGEFYWHDLVGCHVTNPAGEHLGSVFAVEDYGAHPLLKLRDDGGTERMIPFVPAYIAEVDLGARRIVAEWALDY